MKDSLLAGLPVKVDFFYVYPWIMKDIVDLEKDYYQNLFVFFLNEKNLEFPTELKEDLVDYPIYDLIRIRAVWGEAFTGQVLQALKLFTKEEFTFEQNNFVLKREETVNDEARTITHILTDVHWEKIKEVLALENYLDLGAMNGEEDYNFANDKAAEFRKRAAETRRLVEKYKKKKEVSLGFLVNRFCAKSPNLNIQTVWSCTFYQFKQQFEAILSAEQYDFNMSALLQGALDTKKTKIIHWSEDQ